MRLSGGKKAAAKRGKKKKKSGSVKATGYDFLPVNKQSGGGGHLSVRVAKIVGETLIQLGFERGVVQKEELLEVARPKSHPLHDEFEWDDSIAGERFRLQQAAFMIRSVRIIPIVDGKPGAPVRATTSVTVETKKGGGTEAVRGYMFLPAAMEQEDLADQVVANALRSLESWTRIYGQYERLKKAAKVVGKLIEEIKAEVGTEKN